MFAHYTPTGRRNSAILTFHREDTSASINITDSDGDRIAHGWRCASCREVFYVTEREKLSHDCNDNQPIVWTEANIPIKESTHANC